MGGAADGRGAGALFLVATAGLMLFTGTINTVATKYQVSPPRLAPPLPRAGPRARAAPS